MVKKRSAADALDLSSSDEECTDSSEEDSPPARSKAANRLDVDDLKKAGYEEGPSVLFVPEQLAIEEDRELWDWSNGRERHRHKPDEVPKHEREEMRHISSTVVTQGAQHALRAVQHSEQLRAARKAEKLEQAKKKQLTWKDKEKRKRDAGMQASAKNYVEEEKRRAREIGVYTGFDS